jgi:hypothetical protein
MREAPTPMFLRTSRSKANSEIGGERAARRFAGASTWRWMEACSLSEQRGKALQVAVCHAEDLGGEILLGLIG